MKLMFFVVFCLFVFFFVFLLFFFLFFCNLYYLVLIRDGNFEEKNKKYNILFCLVP